MLLTQEIKETPDECTVRQTFSLPVSSLMHTMQPLQEVRAEDFGHVVEREAFQVDAGVQHLYQGARLELGKPC